MENCGQIVPPNPTSLGEYCGKTFRYQATFLRECGQIFPPQATFLKGVLRPNRSFPSHFPQGRIADNSFLPKPLSLAEYCGQIVPSQNYYPQVSIAAKSFLPKPFCLWEYCGQIVPPQATFLRGVLRPNLSCPSHFL